MKYYSTNRRCPAVDLKTAVLQGLAPDGGLYMPEQLLVLRREFWTNWKEKSFAELSLEVLTPWLGDSVPGDELGIMVEDAFNFDVPLCQIEERVNVLELFGGPTCAFKDFAARLMARLVRYFVQQENHRLTILVATSGDTGSAVASGFLGVPDIDVVILYPRGKVSDIQERQLCGMGGNVAALRVEGTFDDCQALVKQAFVDQEIQAKRPLGSANSINIARLLPQMCYYFWAMARLGGKQPVVVSVPSGNFGNLTAGLMAQRMGLPVDRFVAATNNNDAVPRFLMTGEYKPLPSKATISNAMDVGNPSNFVRMLELFDHDAKAMAKVLSGYSFSDDATQSAIGDVFGRSGYVLDPHGAVGYLGLKTELQKRPDTVGIFLETAHPAKFAAVVEPCIGQAVEAPARLAQYLELEPKSTSLANDFQALKTFLLSS